MGTLGFVENAPFFDAADTADTAFDNAARLVTDYAPLLLSYVDADLRYRFVNKGYADWFGYDVRDMVGRTVPEVVGRAAYEGVAHYLAAALRGEVVHFEALMPYDTGSRYTATDLTPDIHPETGAVRGFVGVVSDITPQRIAEAERTQLLLRIAETARGQRTFLRDVLFSVSEGTFCLCDEAADFSDVLLPVGLPVPLHEKRHLRNLRVAVTDAACARDFPDARMQDLISASGEAAMNAVVHGGGGEARVCASPSGDILQIWITDGGKGIGMDFLHKATLERGFTTTGTLGHGFWLMMKTADRLYLLTGETGTTLLLEQERTPPLPLWLQHK